MSSGGEELRKIIESLRLVLVESPVLSGSLSRIFALTSHLGLVYQQLLHDQPVAQRNPTLSKESTNLEECIHALKSVIVKVTSKNEIVEVWTKADKALEVLRQIEARLLQINKTHLTSYLGSTTSTGYIELSRTCAYLDVMLSLDVLLYLRSFIEQTTDDSLLENVGSIHILITYLNTQRIKYVKALQCTHWPIQDCYMISMREINSLFAELLTLEHEEHRKEEGSSAFNRSYGISYRGLWSGRVVHMKKIPLKTSFVRGAFGCMEMVNLLHMNSQCLQDSPFLNSLLGISWDAEQEHIYFISALATHRSLYDVFSNPFLRPEHRVSLSALDKLSILVDVAAGVQHLHQHGYCHGRLKDSNILLFEGNRVKLSDFGVLNYLSAEVKGSQWGLQGLRFAAPEHAQALHQLQDWTQNQKDNHAAQHNHQQQHMARLVKDALTSHGKLPLEASLMTHSLHYVPALSVDIYSVGAIAILLLSEKQLFSNVAWEDAVLQLLLTNQVPRMPTGKYPDQEDLQVVVEEVVDITVTPKLYIRPTATALLATLEEIYCNHVTVTQTRLFEKRHEDVQQVQRELHDLDMKIKDHVELIQKGKEIIGKKEQEKLRIVDGKLRREHEVQMEKARKKLMSFQDELEGLREDKDGAEQDLSQLKVLLKEVEEEQRKGAKYAMQHRTAYPDLSQISQDTLFERYFSERDIERFTTFLQNESARSGRLGSMQPSYSSPFSSFFDSIEHLSPEQNRDFQKLLQEMETSSSNSNKTQVSSRIPGLRRDVYAKTYKYLFDNCESIFRVPIQAKALMPTAVAPQSRNFNYEDDDEDDGNGDGIAAAVSAVVMRDTTVIAPPVSTFNRVSAHVPQQQPATLTGSAASRYQLQTAPDSDDEDFDEDDDQPSALHQHSHQHHHHHNNRPPTIIEVDDDDKDEDEDEGFKSKHNFKERMLSRTDTSRGTSLFGGKLQGQTIGSILKDIEKWVVPISLPLVEEYDDFPTEDYDIVHVQYLAAAVGNWEESVGMRRLRLGFSDEHVAILLDQQYTPIHLAAYLGNLVILRRLVEEAGLPVYTVDAQGESALHSACKRGNLIIVQYLVEACQLAGNQENEKGITPIQCALQGGYLQLVAYFMEHCPYNKISPDFTDSVLHASLLHWSCLGKRVDLVEYLIIQQNIAVDVVCPDDQSTALLWACYGSTCELVKYLIERALADPQVKNSQGWTCLHMATSSGDVEKTIYLLDTVRLKITDKDKNHKTPFDVATGAALSFLQERKKKGFVTGSIAEKNRKETNSKEKAK